MHAFRRLAPIPVLPAQRRAFASIKVAEEEELAPEQAEAEEPAPSAPLTPEQEAHGLFLKGIEMWDAFETRDAKALFARSLEKHRTADTLFNLGNAEYTLGKHSEAIAAWKESLEMAYR